MSEYIAVRRTQAPTGAVYHIQLAVGCVLFALLLSTIPLKWAAAGLLGGGLVFLTLIRPAVGLALVALAIPYGGLGRLPGAGLNGVDALVGLTVVGWLAHGITQRRIIFHRPPLTWSLLIFVWCGALSLTQAASWRAGLPEWFKWVEFAALYLVATQILNRRSAAWTLSALLVAGVAQAVVGAYQFFYQAGPEAFILQGRFLRAYGSFAQPNPYAGYLGYLFPVAASLTLSALGRWRETRHAIHLALAAACGVTTGALLMGITMSWSRGSWLGVIAGGVAIIALRSRRNAALVIGTLVALALLVSAFGTGWLPRIISSRVGDLGHYANAPDPARTEITDANFAVLERLAHWQAGQKMFADHPWLGVGIGNYGAVYEDYALPHWYLALGHAHNIYINFLAEIGVIGFAAFMAFWLGAAWLAWRTARQTDSYASALGIGVLGAWAYLCVHSVFDNLFVQHMQLQLALLLGILVVLRGKTALAPRSETRYGNLSEILFS
jgi:O-antigen ligase